MVICYQDDVVVFGRNREEHAENLTKVIERLRKSGLKLNKDKSSFGQSEIEFLGHIIYSKGIKIDFKKKCLQSKNSNLQLTLLNFVNF